MFFSFDYVIKEMVNVQRATMELWMHLGGLISTQEARVARGDSYASFVLSNLLRASITPWLHLHVYHFLTLILVIGAMTKSLCLEERPITSKGLTVP